MLISESNTAETIWNQNYSNPYDSHSRALRKIVIYYYIISIFIIKNKSLTNGRMFAVDVR